MAHFVTLVTVLKHPLVQAVQVQGCLILLVGVVGWTLSGIRRRREAQRLTAAGYTAALAAGAGAGAGAAAQPAAATGVGTAAAAGKPSPRHVQISVSATSREEGHHHHDAGDPKLTSRQHSSRLRQRTLSTASDATQQKQQTDEGAVHSQVASLQQQSAAPSIYKSRPAGQASLPPWPPLAVVCPVKGCRQHSRDNWATQLAAHYGGPRVFVFAVESPGDPAVAALQYMMQQQQQQCATQQCDPQHQLPGCVLHVWQQAPGQLVLLVNAGLATTCSQKIHNILCGIDVGLAALQLHRGDLQATAATGPCAAAQPPQPAVKGANTPAAAAPLGGGAGGGYVCVLDDDVSLHPLSLSQLVDEMDHDASLFMATGFPFDIVTMSAGSNSSSSSSRASSSSWFGQLLAYAAAAYHLPLLIGFSIADRGNFVWGGVMMLRADYLTQAAAEAAGKQALPEPTAAEMDKAAGVGSAGVAGQQLCQQNILQVWRDGGYSDDLLLAGFCAAHHLTIGLPASAYFPQLLPPSYTMAQYWNYLRRQLYVLDTYYSRHNKTVNHTMMLLHSYSSAVFAGAAATASLQLLMLLGLAVALLVQGLLQQLDRSSSSSTAAAGMGEAAGGIACDSSASSCKFWQPYDCCPASSGSAAAAGLSSSALWQLLCCCTSGSTCLFLSSILLSQAAIGFMTRQALQLFRVLSPGASREVLNPRISWVLLWAGWVLESVLLPYCMLYTYCCDHIMWGGILYYKREGKVHKVVHVAQPAAGS